MEWQATERDVQKQWQFCCLKWPTYARKKIKSQWLSIAFVPFQRSSVFLPFFSISNLSWNNFVGRQQSREHCFAGNSISLYGFFCSWSLDERESEREDKIDTDWEVMEGGRPVNDRFETTNRGTHIHAHHEGKQCQLIWIERQEPTLV